MKPLVDPLCETLSAEAELLDSLFAQVEAQLEAVTQANADALEQAAFATGEGLAQLARLGMARSRQLSLLGRMLHQPGADLQTLIQALHAAHPDLSRKLAEQYASVREKATRVHRHTDTLAFALQLASALGRESMRRLTTNSRADRARGLYAPSGPISAPQTSPNFVNRLG